ncbi:MAG: hypothetical protein MUF58_09390 [Arcicella sp.]|jgi:hypothetical protein|nr:hypothetical protein [Arcicella sp.]
MKKLLTFLILTLTISVFGQIEKKGNPTDFIPKGYVLFEKILGDLNSDSIEDCVLIIKGTDTNKIITDKNRGILDRNRRGIIVLFNKGGQYDLVAKNYDCFSSENEDGGVYFVPELSVQISKGNLYFHYGHGRYGYWKYTFRFQKSDFELIGYDANENRGPIINSETSINFSTKIKQTKVNTNKNAESGEEVFKTATSKIKIDKLMRLSNIKDIDELEMYNY